MGKSILIHSLLFTVSNTVSGEMFDVMFISHTGNIRRRRGVTSYRQSGEISSFLQSSKCPTGFVKDDILCLCIFDTRSKARSCQSGFSGCFWWNRMGPAGGEICVVDWDSRDCWVPMADCFYWEHEVPPARWPWRQEFSTRQDKMEADWGTETWHNFSLYVYFTLSSRSQK